MIHEKTSAIKLKRRINDKMADKVIKIYKQIPRVDSEPLRTIVVDSIVDERLK